MKHLVAIILSVLFAESWAQHSTLTTFNPIPRQGAEIEIQFSLEKQDLSALKNKKDKTTEENDLLYDNYFGNGSLKMRKLLTDTGKVSIGPFSFTFGESTYQTNVLTLQVHPKLPGNIRDGLWIRYVELDDRGYLIIEQRIDTKAKKEKTPDGISYSIGGGEAIFATLNEKKIENYGLKIIRTSSRTEADEIDKIDDELYSGLVSYKEFIYILEKQPNFKGPVKLDKKLFDHFPEKVFTEDVVIR